jgi:hypothetical protein
MNMGNFEVSIRLTTDRRLCGQYSGRPSGEEDQSWARMSAPISPPIRKSEPEGRLSCIAPACRRCPGLPFTDPARPVGQPADDRHHPEDATTGFRPGLGRGGASRLGHAKSVQGRPVEHAELWSGVECQPFRLPPRDFNHYAQHTMPRPMIFAPREQVRPRLRRQEPRACLDAGCHPIREEIRWF